MPNYNLVANTQFKARTFEDLIKPYMLYTQAYREQEDALSDLSTKADIWQGLANEQTDPLAYAQYKNYADSLKEQAKLLSVQGLTPNSRSALMNLKRRYSSEITPIEQAYSTKKMQTEEQRKAFLQNPSLMISRNASTTSLDDYMNNPNLSYDSYSGALLAQQTGQMASNIAKELTGMPKGKSLNSYTHTWMAKYGLTAQEVEFAINNPKDPRSNRALQAIKEQAITASGVRQWADKQTLEQAENWANIGLWNAIGQTQVHTYTDEITKQKLINGDTKPTPVLPTTPNFDRRNVRTSQEIEDQDNLISDWSKVKQYFKKDKRGYWAMTPEGKKQSLTIEKTRATGGTAATVRYVSIDSDLGKFLKKHGLLPMHEGKNGPKQSAKLDKIVATVENQYDTNVATEYTRIVDPSQYDNVIAVVNSISKGGKVHNYTRNKKDNSFEFTRDSEEVGVNELTTADIKSAMTVFGKHGNYLEIKLKDGNTLHVPVSSYSNNYDMLLSGNMATIEGYKKAQKDGYKKMNMPSGQIYAIDDLINAELNAMGDNMISSLGVSQVKPTQVNRGEYATQVQ